MRNRRNMHLQMKPVEEAKRVFSNRSNLDRYLKYDRRFFACSSGYMKGVTKWEQA